MDNHSNSVPPSGVRGLFERDLNRLRTEIEAYSDETLLWKRAEGINNPAGNLALHLVGNLNTYIGKNLGTTGYIRNRPLEFTDIIPKNEILERIDKTKAVVLEVISNLSSDDFSKIYPENILGYEMTTEYFLIHLYGHLNYHLGQINYHRRMI